MSVNMSSRIEHLPVEVQSSILSYLRHADLADLALVSKSFRRLVTPLLWTHIELHPLTWHEHFQYKDIFDFAATDRNNRSRNYVRFPSDESDCHTLCEYCPRTDGHRYYNLRAERYVRFLRVFDKVVYPTYFKIFGDDTPFKHLESLCLDIDFDKCLEDDESLTLDFWSIFSGFQNLVSLELIVNWTYYVDAWDIREQRFCEHESSLLPLTRLRKLSLRGYIPRNFARWTLICPNLLNTLELSILDRPIGGNAHHPRRNPPPELKSDESSLEDTEDDGGEIRWVTEESDSDSEEDLDQEAIGPRALAIFEGIETPVKLEALSTLILTRPAESRLQERGDGWHSWRDAIHCSVRSDEAVLQEWTHLIRANRSTLQHLILDQRPFCEEIEDGSTGHDEFLEMYPYGPGFQRFKEIVLPVLLEDAEWPALKSLHFYGFDVPEPRRTKPHPRIHRPWPSQQLKEKSIFLPQVEERFESLGVNIQSSLGRRMMFRAEDGVVLSGDGLGGRCAGDD